MNTPVLNSPFQFPLDSSASANDINNRYGYNVIKKSDLTFRILDNLERLREHNPAVITNLMAPKRDHVELAMTVAGIAELFGNPVHDERQFSPILDSVVYRDKDTDPVNVYFFINPDRAGGFTHTHLVDPVIVRIAPRDNMNPVYEFEEDHDPVNPVIVYDSKIDIVTLENNNGMVNERVWCSIGDYFGSDTQGVLIRRIGRLIEHAYMIRYAQAKGIALTPEQTDVFNRSMSLALIETLKEASDPRRDNFRLDRDIKPSEQARELAQKMAEIIKD